MGITEVVNMKLENHPFDNLVEVCKVMGWKQPDRAAVEKLLEDIAAQHVRAPTMGDAMSSREKKKAAKKTATDSIGANNNNTPSSFNQQPAPPKQKKIDVVRFYGICLDTQSCEVLLSSIRKAVAAVTDDSDLNAKSVFESLERNKRFSSNRFHITLAINPIRLAHEKDESFVLKSGKLFESYQSGELKSFTSNDGCSLEFKTLQLVWDDRVMCLSVDKASLDSLKITSVNDHPHITIGTQSAAIPPAESNLVLAKFAAAAGNTNVKTLPLPLTLKGKIKPYRY
jgi:hypothetical protein